MISVRVIEQGGAFREVSLQDNSTVEIALRAAGARLDVAKTIRVNNEESSLTDVLDNGDSVFVIPNVKGNWFLNEKYGGW